MSTMQDKMELNKPNVEAELAKYAKEMEEAEDALVDKGFSADQWMLVKKYVHAAIAHSQWSTAKAMQDLSPSALAAPEK
jgi:hypothetical protein